MAEDIPRELKITDLSPDGRGLGFVRAPGDSGRGLPTFVEGALPGQTVACRVLRRAKSFIEARALAVLEERENVAPLRAECQSCGGCPLARMPYAEQLIWKEKLARETLVRVGKFPREELDRIWRPLLPSPKIEGYRNKLELAFGRDVDGSPALGFRRRASREIAPSRHCVLAEPAANRLIDLIGRKTAESGEPWGFWRFLILRRGFLPGATAPMWLAILKTARADSRQRKATLRLAEAVFALEPELGAFIHEETDASSWRSPRAKRIFALNRAGENNAKNAVFEIPLGGKNFRLDASSFFQVNDGAAEKLAEIVRSFSPGQGGVALDLYCGAGAPGLLLAPGYDRYVGVELDAVSVRMAKENAGDIPAVFYACDAGAFAANPRRATAAPSLLLLDPPRAGVDETAARAISALAPENVIYISCNPATFARDSQRLRQTHEPVALASVDMFPHTPHLELASFWRRKENLK